MSLVLLVGLTCEGCSRTPAPGALDDAAVAAQRANAAMISASGVAKNDDYDAKARIRSEQ